MPDPELDALRRAWSSIQPPEAHRSLAEEDADTQRAVAWLQEAFQVIQPAAPARQAARRRPLLRLASLAAAAAVLAALGVHFLRTESAAMPPAEATARAPVPTPLAPATPVAPAAPAVQVLASSHDRVELQAGSVRLTLLHAPPAAPADLQPLTTQTP